MGRRVRQAAGWYPQAGVDGLGRLDAATGLSDLAGLRGNRLKALKGERVGQWSIRINDQWRVCFMWLNGAPGPSDVEIVDYH